MSTNDFFDKNEFISYFKDETTELLQVIDKNLLLLEKTFKENSDNKEIISSLFRALHTIKGSAGMLEFEQIQRISHKLESIFDLLRIKNQYVNLDVIEMLFQGRDVLYNLVDLELSNKPVNKEILLYEKNLDNFLEKHELSSDEKQENLDTFFNISDNDNQSSTEISKDNSEYKNFKKETIRVDIEKLNLMLNLIGELIITRTRIYDIAKTLNKYVSVKNSNIPVKQISTLTHQLLESSSLLTKTSDDIQDSIIDIRMVPIGQVFERFPRLIRDLAKTSNKKIEVTIHGEETHLDKSLVDEIGEPIMHLIRNSVDHGIEPSDIREKLGKSPHGTITLNSYHQGNQVIVEVSDDGAGMDLQKIHTKALNLGIVDKGDFLEERDIVELIFTPGFSTSEHITNISGRGVGMDIVRNNVQKLKGVIDIYTIANEGTKFIIKLPLTLAIIQCLLIKVSNEVYSIPLEYIIESQKIQVTDIHRVQESESIQMRDKFIPLLRLREFFEVGKKDDTKTLMVVIVEIHGRRIGLVVDEFLKEQEIVVKPLSSLIGKISGVSGATVLGDGTISLIVDIEHIIESSYKTMSKNKGSLLPKMRVGE